MHQITYFVLAIARFDQPEKWIVILLMASQDPVPESAVVNRLGPSAGHTAVKRAIRRLVRDQVVAAIQRGYLQVVDPRSWPEHRLTGTDLVTLEQLVGHVHDVPAVSADQPKLEHKAIALAREAARSHMAKTMSTQQKIHEVQLDVDLAPPPRTNPATSRPAISTANYVGEKCPSCVNARKVLATPGDPFHDWAWRHLEVCGTAKAGKSPR